MGPCQHKKACTWHKTMPQTALKYSSEQSIQLLIIILIDSAEKVGIDSNWRLRKTPQLPSMWSVLTQFSLQEPKITTPRVLDGGVGDGGGHRTQTSMTFGNLTMPFHFELGQQLCRHDLPGTGWHFLPQNNGPPIKNNEACLQPPDPIRDNKD